MLHTHTHTHTRVTLQKGNDHEWQRLRTWSRLRDTKDIWQDTIPDPVYDSGPGGKKSFLVCYERHY